MPTLLSRLLFTAMLLVALQPAHAETRKPQHMVAIQVDDNIPAKMTLALNNAENIIEYYTKKNQTVDVQVVTYGPGLHMVRADTSPVKERIAELSLAHPNLHFSACENTRSKMALAEKKTIPLIAEAVSVPAGVVTLMELQAKGYAYIHP